MTHDARHPSSPTIDDDTSNELSGTRTVEVAESGLYVTLGPLDANAFRTHIEPAFVAYDHDHSTEALLHLAESIAEAGEAAVGGDEELPEAIERLVALGDRLISLMEDAEDLGFDATTVSHSPMSDEFLTLEDTFIFEVIAGSKIIGTLLADGPANPFALAAVAAPRCITHRRAYLQFWLLNLVRPDFRGVDLPGPDEFKKTLSKTQPASGILKLLHGDWQQWPPFRPDQVLSLGNVHNEDVELTPRFDWVICSPESTAVIATLLGHQVRCFLHLEHLRVTTPRIYGDLLDAFDPTISDQLIRDYERVIEKLPWTEDVEAAWQYISSDAQRPSPPSVPRLPSDLPDAHRHATDVLAAYKDVVTLFRDAANANEGVYVLLHEEGAHGRTRRQL